MAVAEVALGKMRTPGSDEGEGLTPYLRAANVGDGKLRLDDIKSMRFSTAEFVRFALSPQDVLLTEASGSREQVGQTAVYEGEPASVAMQNTVVRLRPRDGLDARYLYWWSRHAYGSGLYARAAQGLAIWHLSAERLKRLPVPVIDAGGQRRIADFLDDQVTLLDQAIQLRQRQIDLLEERASARAYSAVLGQDEQGPRSAVGADWIQSVPIAWTVQPVGRLFDIQLGKMLAPERTTGEHMRPYLRNTNVQWDRIDTQDLNEMNFPPSERARYEVLDGDLLVCEGGEVGRAAIWTGPMIEMYYQKALHRLRPTAGVSARWIYYVLRVATRLGVFSTGGTATIPHLTGEQLRAQRMPFAPSDVEGRLIKRLDEESAQERTLHRLYDMQIALLKERKQSLITAAVTGDFDVTTARRVTADV